MPARRNHATPPVVRLLARALGAIAFLVPAGAARQDPEPLPHAQAWRIESFLEDAGLEREAIFHIDFEPNGTVWVAATSGLHRYDGYRWRRFGAEDGLPSSYVRCVTAAGEGRVWVGTDRGAGLFDGARFDWAGTPENLAGPSVRRIVLEPDGTTWFCCDQWPDPGVPSGLTRLRGGEWKSFGTADGLPSDYVQDVFVDSRDERFVLTDAGLAQFRGERLFQPLADAGLAGIDGPAWSMVEIPAAGLLVCIRDSYFVREDGRWRAVSAGEEIRAPQKLASTRDGAIVGCTSDARARFLEWRDGRLVPASDVLREGGGHVEFLAESPDGSIWAVGLGKLLRWERRGGEWETYADLPPPCLRDERGAVWFGDERGVLRLDHDGWSAFEDLRPPLVAGEDGAVWALATDGLARWRSAGSWERFAALEIGFEPRELVRDGAGDLWALGANAGGELSCAHLEGGRWRSRGLGVVGARPAFVRGDPREGVWVVYLTSSDTHEIAFVDGLSVTSVPAPPQYAGAELQVLRDARERLWGYGLFGLNLYDAESATWLEVAGLGRHACGASTLHGEPWFGFLPSTGGTGGIAHLGPNGWETFPSDARTISSEGGDASPLFFGSLGRVYVVDDALGPRAVQLPEQGVPRAVVRGAGDELWIGLDDLVLHCRPDGAPARTVIEHPPELVQSGEDALLGIHGVRAFRTRRSSHVRAQIRVDGGEWETTGILQEKDVRLAGLAVGEHVLQVRVLDEWGRVDPDPVEVTLRVLSKPLQQRMLFRPVASLVFAALLALAAFALTTRRRIQLQARGLEEQVRRRTSALARSERKYRTLFEQSRDAVFLTDTRLSITDANSTAVRLVGAEDSALQGRQIGDLLVDSPAKERLLEDLSHARDRAETPVELCTLSGARLQTLVTASARREGDGTAGLQVIVRDVTRQREIEEQLRNSQKMEAIGRLAGGIAHDFNNVLTGIIGYAELVAQAVRGQPQLESDVAVIVKNAQRAKALTQQIRAFSRTSSSAPSPVDINEVVAGTEPLLSSLLGDTVTLEMRLYEGAGRVLVNPAKLEQVVVNLAVNARDAMPAGGLLVVSTARVRHASGERVQLEVSDTGTGIDPGIRSKIFEPFFTTKPLGRGTGLGLSIVNGVAQDCGATVEVESEQGYGSTFRILFPVSRSEGPGALESGEPPGSYRGTESILVVDDEEAIRELVREALEDSGYEVSLAGDGKEALERLRERDGDVDLVITDVVMPRLDGRELAGELRERYPRVPFLFISGFVDAAAASPGPLEGPIVEKPFNLAALQRRVRELLDAHARSIV